MPRTRAILADCREQNTTQIGKVWTLADPPRHTRYVEQSKDLHEGARGLADRTIDMARLLVQGALGEIALVPGGRKGNQLDVKAQL